MNSRGRRPQPPSAINGDQISKIHSPNPYIRAPSITRDVVFVHKVGQIGPKLVKYWTFSGHISVHFDSVSQIVGLLKSYLKSLGFVPFETIWPNFRVIFDISVHDMSRYSQHSSKVRFDLDLFQTSLMSSRPCLVYSRGYWRENCVTANLSF